MLRLCEKGRTAYPVEHGVRGFQCVFHFLRDLFVKLRSGSCHLSRDFGIILAISRRTRVGESGESEKFRIEVLRFIAD